MIFEKEFKVSYNPANVVAVDINEDSITLAVYKYGGSPQ